MPFEQKAQHFHFALVPANHVASAAYGISKFGFSSLCQITNYQKLKEVRFLGTSSPQFSAHDQVLTVSSGLTKFQ